MHTSMYQKNLQPNQEKLTKLYSFTGECMGGGPREVADHFLDLHSSRLLPEENGRGRHQGESSPRNLVPHVDELVAHLARFRERAERQAPPSRRTQMTQTIPATLMPVVTSSFLQLQDLPAALAPTAHLIQVNFFFFISVAFNFFTLSVFYQKIHRLVNQYDFFCSNITCIYKKRL